MSIYLLALSVIYNNLSVAHVSILHAFPAAPVGGARVQGACCFFRRRFLPVSTDPPEAIKKEFEKYADAGGVMGVQELAEFLAEVQGMPPGAGTAQAIIDDDREAKPLKVFQKKKGLSLDAF